MMDVEFKGFPKIYRLNREIQIQEKIDGTNSQIFITHINKEYEDPFQLGYWYGEDASTWAIYAGSRTRWINPENDNYGFASWVKANIEELKKLGPGRHFGEWWGQGIQRKYNMKEKVFSLFNTERWRDDEKRPKCCRVVPVLHQGLFDTEIIGTVLESLREFGSVAAGGFMNPEGIIIRHLQSGHTFKKTFEDKHKEE